MYGDLCPSSADGGFVKKEPISEGGWLSWCTYDGRAYSQEVQDKISELNKSDFLISNTLFFSCVHFSLEFIFVTVYLPIKYWINHIKIKIATNIPK